MNRPFAALMRQLKARAQFLNAAKGKRVSGKFFVLQSVAVDRHDAGIGYTVTKRVGNSPERSRIKRRLRAVVLACQNRFYTQHDYVLIGRRATLNAPFDMLVQTLIRAIAKSQASGFSAK